MLDPKLIRQNIDLVAEQMKRRGFAFPKDEINDLEEKRKLLQTKMQELQNERNTISKLIGQKKAAGDSKDEAEIASRFQQVKKIGEELKETEDSFSKVQDELQQLLAVIPNILDDSVPLGKSEADNKVVRIEGEPTQFNFKPKDHVDLGAQLGMDFGIAAKMSGARFVVLHDKLAKLHRALAQFMLDLHTNQHGYKEVAVPYIVHADALFGTGQLPNLKEDLFSIHCEDESYLIPTAEVSVTNIVRDEILNADQLPLKFVCHSPCFRSEAGSYGKDTRGMIRQHQFEKVELVHIVHPEHSALALEELTSHAEAVLKRLQLPYRVVALCSADIGFAAAKTYDLEVWLPGQQQYREISSCSNTKDFQARRLKARFKDVKTGKTELVHTLNGSALAVGRTLVAVLENFQDENGCIHIPEVLQPYMGGLRKLEP